MGTATSITGDGQRGGMFGAHWSGGGGIANPWTPCMSSAAGAASLEVHFLDLSGHETHTFSYTVPAALTGVYGLSRTDSLNETRYFADDIGRAVGFIGYARTADIALGRGGLRDADGGGNLGNLFCQSGSTSPETIPIGFALAWAVVAGSDGWDMRDAVGGDEIIVTQPSYGAATETTPTIADSTSTTILAARTAPKATAIYNGSSANIMISWSGNTLSGITVTSTNKGLVVAPGQLAEPPAGWNPTGAVTCYQTSGGPINSVYVLTG